jgi:hypothetical protein
MCAAALAVCVGGAPGAADDQAGDCVDRLLAVASTNTDNFPHLYLFPDPDQAPSFEVHIDGISCIAQDGPADIYYVVVDGGTTNDLDVIDFVAVGDDLVVVEPGGDPHERLEDPGATWSEVDGATELVHQLLGDGVAFIEIGLPDLNHSPVLLLGRSGQSTGAGSKTMRVVNIVWGFAEGTAGEHVEEVEAALAEAGHDSFGIDVGDSEISVVIRERGETAPALPPLRELALFERDDTAESEGSVPGNAQPFPDVIDVQVECGDDGYNFAVTVSSPYDTPERYADGWRVVGRDGSVFGEHQLAHDHAAEQPFTRTQSGVHIPADVDEVVVEGHDLDNGYGGRTVTVALPDCE